MDNSFQEFFSLILTLSICAAPFVLLAVAGGVVAFFMYRSKKQRTERIQMILSEISNISLSGVEAVTQLGPNAIAPLTEVLVDGSRLFQSLIRGDAIPLEKRTLNKFTQSLRDYKQRASYGELPEIELTELRQDDLQRVESLITATTLFVNTAEAGDVKSACQHLQDIDSMFAEVYRKHLDFCQELAEKEVEFPVPQPLSTTTQPIPNPQLVSAQIIQQLPEDKKMLFMMQYNTVQKNPTTAVLLAVFLGGIGAHKFYMGQVGLGIVYLLFSWTWIPAIIGIIEAFSISNQVHRYNAQKATEIAAVLK